MKLVLIAALALVAAAAAAPAAPAAPAAEPIKIIRSEFDQQPEGAYVYSFETENGIVRNENGEVKQVVDEENKTHDVVVVRGSYIFIDNDGKSHTINYYADETGYHAEGEDIPKEQAARR